ncbi:Voltage-dependent T-type calcium channel subunit alpha-1G (Voltage-gated calcium channel subunit alpha Cav3.1) [Durusdinium trenchii]|uniref:Voltage-dependent T-type calcium channel subunit alpha-1G (Voltage-gated calcium channel subunit alpha Cav3.1) n=1 Tax=Durusdinium trenchii TaxID=1381693 RepID=A0ABP0HKF2_9DINO
MPLPVKSKSATAWNQTKTEELLQECADDTVWRKPPHHTQSADSDSDSDSALGGTTSSSEEGDSACAVSPDVPILINPNDPLSTPDHLLLSRANSQTQYDQQRLLDSLASFRDTLVANHAASLSMLDQELEKVKHSMAMVAATASTSLLVPGKSTSKSSAGREVRVKLPGALGTSDDFSGTEFVSVDKKGDEAPFAHFQSLEKSRKRRLSWIPKTGGSFGHDLHVDTIEEELPSAPIVAHLTREEKSKAKKEAEDYQEAGMLSHFNADLAKEQIRKKAAEEFEMPSEVLKSDGILAKIAKHHVFGSTTMVVIFLNAIWISIDIEFNNAPVLSEADAIFIVVENLFCSYFTAELLIRFGSYKRTCTAMKDLWFLFDLMLVALMIFETWAMPIYYAASGGGSGLASGTSVLRIFRIMRVLRTARMARLVRLMPELMILIKGMMVACRSVFFTLVLLLLITYVFSVAFMTFGRDSEIGDKYFGSMGDAVINLIMRLIFSDQADFFETASRESFVMGLLVLLFILFGSLTVMNMLLGVLVEAINTVSTIEREQLEVDFAKKALWELISKGDADEDGDNRISEQEFVNVLSKPQAVTALTSLGVDVEAALDYGKLLFEDGEPLTFGDFMKGILTLRGSNQTTVKDIVDLRKFIAEEFSETDHILREICGFLTGLFLCFLCLGRGVDCNWLWAL